MPLPHLSHIGSLCKFPAGADDLVVGARTFLVTIGRVPAKQKRSEYQYQSCLHFVNLNESNPVADFGSTV